jgi:hypothetical protein
MAVCHWEVDTLDHLMQVAGSLQPTWKIEAFVAKNMYKKGLF